MINSQSTGFSTFLATTLAILFLAACSEKISQPTTMSGAASAESFIRNLDTPRDRAIRERLEENVKEISADQQSLQKVISFLRDNTKTEFFVNWTALQAAGVDRNTPVTFNLRNLPLRTVLTTILREVGGNVAFFDYTVDEGMIVISTRDDIWSARYQTTQLFDISPLLQNSLSAEQRAQRYREIINAIYTSVAPGSWQNAGGTVGTLAQFDNFLVITQTHDNHVAIARLLGKMQDGQSTHK